MSVNGGIYEVTKQMCMRTVQALSWFSSKYAHCYHYNMLDDKMIFFLRISVVLGCCLSIDCL